MKHTLTQIALRGAALALLLTTTACGEQGVGGALGFERDAPDEFTVVSRPSLSVPPDFNLRPPRPGEPPRQPKADAAARSIVTGKPIQEGAQPGAATSSASDAFLKRIGADQADANIRAQLAEDETAPVDTSKAGSLYEKMIGQDKAEPVIDAAKETERLRKNKAEGKPANEGEVPVEPVKPPSMIDKIF